MLFRSNDTATTEIYTAQYTLSLHDALPISSWQKCVGSSLAVDTSDTSSLWEFGDVTSTDGLIAQVANQEDADGWGCQHALAAASNLTVETWVCAYNLADEATTMAIDIINNASER